MKNKLIPAPPLLVRSRIRHAFCWAESKKISRTCLLLLTNIRIATRSSHLKRLTSSPLDRFNSLISGVSQSISLFFLYIVVIYLYLKSLVISKNNNKLINTI